ncbi:MAG: hypothetical protein ACYTDY_00470 [Planctomycetota bacterium]|jgi:hypothetical protein
MNRTATLLVALLLFGCASARDHYDAGDEITRQLEQPDAEQVAAAQEKLDLAITTAEEELREGEYESETVRYDATAYIIPLARLAKARLAKRFDQITELEKECWQAIWDSERYLGEHIQRLKGGAAEHKSLGASVFFRREKIRRHAFALLLDEYRRAGEKDLELLLLHQIGFSQTYLLSPVAHGEEEFIRKVENADWVREYNLSASETRYNMLMALLVTAKAMSSAASQMQKDSLDAQAQADPSMRPYVEQQKQQIDLRDQENMKQFEESMQKLREAHEREVEGIETSHESTVAQSLASNFELVNVSDAVKNLTEYGVLEKLKRDYDDYVRRHGFDETAAEKLIKMRSSLDNLTRELQRRRAAKAGR